MKRGKFIRATPRPKAKSDMDKSAIKKSLLKNFDFKRAERILELPRPDTHIYSVRTLRIDASNIIDSILEDPDIDYVHSGIFKVEKVWQDDNFFIYELLFVPFWSESIVINDSTNEIIK